MFRLMIRLHPMLSFQMAGYFIIPMSSRKNWTNPCASLWMCQLPFSKWTNKYSFSVASRYRHKIGIALSQGPPMVRIVVSVSALQLNYTHTLDQSTLKSTTDRMSPSFSRHSRNKGPRFGNWNHLELSLEWWFLSGLDSRILVEEIPMARRQRRQRRQSRQLPTLGTWRWGFQFPSLSHVRVNYRALISKIYKGKWGFGLIFTSTCDLSSALQIPGYLWLNLIKNELLHCLKRSAKSLWVRYMVEQSSKCKLLEEKSQSKRKN